PPSNRPLVPRPARALQRALPALRLDRVEIVERILQQQLSHTSEPREESELAQLGLGQPRTMVGRDWIEPPTTGFSVLNLNRPDRAPSQLVAISKVRGRCSALLRPIASCYAAWVTISVTDA